MITHLGHTAIRTRDLDASLKFYTEVIGLREAFRMCGDDGKPFIVYLYIAPHEFIELFPDGKSEPNRDPKAIGYVHICLEVDDVEAEYARITAMGVPTDTDVILGKAKCRQFWIKDPDGNPLELMELPPESRQMQAILKMVEEQK